LSVAGLQTLEQNGEGRHFGDGSQTSKKPPKAAKWLRYNYIPDVCNQPICAVLSLLIFE